MILKKYFKLTILVLGLLIFLTAGGLAGMRYTSRPDFCLNCHIMQPAVASWSAASHQGIGCLECHREPGWTGYLKGKIGGIGEVYSYLTNNYDGLFSPKLTDANCLSCHGSKSKFNKAKDITASQGPRAAEFSHQYFLQKFSSCLECHQEVGHGEVGYSNFK